MTDGPGFELMIKAYADLGDKVDGVHSSMKGMTPVKPVSEGFRVFGAQIVGPTSPALILPSNPPNGPATGLAWNVRWMGLTGVVDTHSVVTGTPEFYSGPIPSENGGVTDPIIANFSDWIATGTQIPFSTTFPRHTIWAHTKETPYALVYGATPGVQLFLLAYVEVWRKCDVERLSI